MGNYNVKRLDNTNNSGNTWNGYTELEIEP